ncbi:hypothetical protein GCM10027341_53810 [Spirosoma knui]
MKLEYDRLKTTIPDEFVPDKELRKLAYEQADLILCPSEFVKSSFIQQGFAPDKILKVNFGIPLFRNSTEINKKGDSTFRILYVGQLHYRKGLRYAIEAFKKLRHPNKEFVIVGPKTRITGLENVQMPENVIFTGPLKGDLLEYQYKRASVFILPSIEEGLALVQGEALSYGLPLVTTTNSGGNDLIDDGIEGFIVKPFDPDLILEKLQILADSPHILESMSYQASKTAQTLDNWDVAVEKLRLQLSAKMRQTETI